MSKCAASAFFFIKQKTVITTLISKDGKSDIVKKSRRQFGTKSSI
jgi:hypothetical protein